MFVIGMIYLNEIAIACYLCRLVPADILINTLWWDISDKISGRVNKDLMRCCQNVFFQKYPQFVKHYIRILINFRVLKCRRQTCVLGRMRTVSLGVCGQWKPRSACASAQSDQGLRCQLTKSLDTTKCTKTRLYNLDPLKPHFYIVKLGFTGVYIIFLISAQKHRLWVLVRTASARGRF